MMDGPHHALATPNAAGWPANPGWAYRHPTKIPTIGGPDMRK
jgi:hypothetical protein